MTDSFYKEAFDSAVAELRKLMVERTEAATALSVLEQRIERVRHGAVSLASLADMDFQKVKNAHPELFEEQVDARMGITDAVREVLTMGGKWMIVPEIKERVFQIAPGVAAQKNPNASIHTV